MRRLGSLHSGGSILQRNRAPSRGKQEEEAGGTRRCYADSTISAAYLAASEIEPLTAFISI